MENFTKLASIIITIIGAIGGFLGWIIQTSLNAKEDIIRQKDEKILHLEKNRDQLLQLKDEQIKLLELQLKAKEKKPRTARRKSQSCRQKTYKK